MSMNRFLSAAVSLLLVAVALAGCTATDPNSKPEPNPSQAGAIPEINFTATDYNFSGPNGTAAGLTKVTLRNEGFEWHEIQFIKLDAGKTAADLFAAMMNAGQGMPAWAKHFGGPGPANHSESVSVYMNFTEGAYVLVCPIPSPMHGGQPHMMLGQVRLFNVTKAAGGASRAAPTPSLTVTLGDYEFNLSKNLTAGTHVIRVVNRGQEPHEFIVAKLQPGKTAEDLLAVMGGQVQGPPPGKPVGGMPAIEPGMSQDVILNVEQGGTYAFLCFIESPSTHAAHFALGMKQTVTVA